jgi:lambda family phage minor tail protein L
MSALQHVQELDQTADVFLYQLSNYSQSNPLEVTRFANMSGVFFDGSYIAIAVSHTSQEISSTGSQPQMTLTISDTLGTIGALLNSIDGAIEGAKLRVIRTKAKYLSTGSTPSTTNGILQRSDLVITRVEQYVPGEVINLVASSVLDFGGGETACPSRVCHVKCPGAVEYRGPYCGYSGSRMFDLANNPVIDSSLDRCNKQISGCRARFGEGAVLPFGGFPSVTRR